MVNMKKNNQEYITMISEIEEMIDGSKEIANEELRSIYPYGQSRGWSNTLKTWNKSIENGWFTQWNHLTSFKGRLATRLSKAQMDYSRIFGTIPEHKSIKIIEEEVKQHSDEHYHFGRTLLFMKPGGHKLPVIYRRNSASFAYVDLSFEKMDEIFEEWYEIQNKLLN